MTIQPIPNGFHTLTPYLVLNNASAFLAFLETAFDAEVISRHEMQGSIKNVIARIGDSMLMCADATEQHLATAGVILYLYVKDADTWYHRAIKAGAASVMPPSDQFYGDRNAAVQDSWGNQWWFATHIEDVSEEELIARAEKFKK